MFPFAKNLLFMFDRLDRTDYWKLEPQMQQHFPNTYEMRSWDNGELIMVDHYQDLKNDGIHFYSENKPSLKKIK